MTQYEAIIGIEIHIRLQTVSKMYCGTTNADSDIPNQYTCPICMGHPGTLPHVNQEAIRLARLLALAMNCELQLLSTFARKHYFYPDLPKGYQISQYDQPLATNGYLEVMGEDLQPVRVGIERLHIEEDTARLKHGTDGSTLADFNRAGAPLVELVTRPDIRSAAVAKAFVQELQHIVRTVGASSADMEKGQMRCDANISLRPVGDTALYPKTEVKNMNSFRSIERAIEYEIERQTLLWEDGKAPEFTTTRGWNDKRGDTVLQRSKEIEADYRYFPEPDLPPLTITTEEVEQLRCALPELPAAKRNRFRGEYGLSISDASVLVADPVIASFYENTISELRSWLNTLEDTLGSDAERWQQHGARLSRMAFSWITSEVFRILREQEMVMSAARMSAENFAELLSLLFEKRINSSAGQKMLQIMIVRGGDPSLIMQQEDLEQVSDDTLIQEAVRGVLAAHTSVVEDYKGGKEHALMYLVGQVMKATKGKVNPERAASILKEEISGTVENSSQK